MKSDEYNFCNIGQCSTILAEHLLHFDLHSGQFALSEERANSKQPTDLTGNKLPFYCLFVIDCFREPSDLKGQNGLWVYRMCRKFRLGMKSESG